MSDREALEQSIDDLSPMGVRFVARMVDSPADPPRVRFAASELTWIGVGSDADGEGGFCFAVLDLGLAGPVSLTPTTVPAARMTPRRH